MWRAGSLLFALVHVRAMNDYHEDCQKWAHEDAQCIENSRYMHAFCQKSCHDFNHDDDDRCDGWAAEGECVANPNYIQLHCARSCGSAVSWNPWVRQQLGIDRVPTHLDHVASNAQTDDSTSRIGEKIHTDAPGNLFHAAELMRARVHAFVEEGQGTNGLHSSFSSASPTPLMGAIGLTEAILYALRLYEGVVLESTDLPGEETARGAQASRTLSVLVTARDSIINVIRDSHWNEDMIVRFMGAWTDALRKAGVATQSVVAHTTLQTHLHHSETLSVHTQPSGFDVEPHALMLPRVRRRSNEHDGVHVAGSPYVAPENIEAILSEPRPAPAAEARSIEPMHRVEATGLVTSPVFLLRDTEAPMPTIGFGTWQLDGEDAVSAVTAALEEGYRHFDCAEAYGNEAQVGQALATFLEKQQAEANGVQRKHIFLASKMSNPRPEPHDSGSGESYDSYLRNKVAHQLGLLRTDYLDLYMLHSPLGAHTAEAWAVLESMLAEGTIRAIGVSNFGVGELEQLLKTAKVVPHVVQNKFDIYHRGTQFSTSPENLMGFCRQHQIRLVSYSPLSAYPFVLKPTRDPIAAAAGAAYGVSAARVVLAWIVEQGVAVIPRSTQREHMRENLVAVGQPISHSSSSSADDDFNFKKPLVFTNEMHTSLLPLHVRTSLDWLSDISSTPYTIN